MRTRRGSCAVSAFRLRRWNSWSRPWRCRCVQRRGSAPVCAARRQGCTYPHSCAAHVDRLAPMQSTPLPLWPRSVGLRSIAGASESSQPAALSFSVSPNETRLRSLCATTIIVNDKSAHPLLPPVTGHHTLVTFPNCPPSPVSTGN